MTEFLAHFASEVSFGGGGKNLSNAPLVSWGFMVFLISSCSLGLDISWTLDITVLWRIFLSKSVVQYLKTFIVISNFSFSGHKLFHYFLSTQLWNPPLFGVYTKFSYRSTTPQLTQWRKYLISRRHRQFSKPCFLCWEFFKTLFLPVEYYWNVPSTLPVYVCGVDAQCNWKVSSFKAFLAFMAHIRWAILYGTVKICIKVVSLWWDTWHSLGTIKIK